VQLAHGNDVEQVIVYSFAHPSSWQSVSEFSSTLSK
jgi:hypothetical protein